MELSSPHNEFIKSVTAIVSGVRQRTGSARYIVEGAVSVFAAEKAVGSIRGVVVAESYVGGIPASERCYRVSDAVFKKLTDTVTPQGILAVLDRPSTAMSPPKGDALILDAVRDPGNMGAIIRTAAALGIEDLYLADCVDPFNPKSVRASMTGVFFVRFHVGTVPEILKNVVPNCEILTADMGGENLFSADNNRNTERAFALIVGNEAHGVRPELRKVSNRIVALPMKNIESLNAAISASVILYYLKHAK